MFKFTIYILLEQLRRFLASVEILYFFKKSVDRSNVVRKQRFAV